MSNLSGTVLDGKYELVDLIGEGGMGSVYEARHMLIGRRLAVKFLHSQYVASEEVVTRFQREAQAAAAIGHENIIEVTDMGKDEEGAPYLVMEYLDGLDVRELLADAGALPIERTAHIMVQSLSALHAAHEAGIIHRDLKPENIYLIEKSDRKDYVKLLDFGISKFRTMETEGMKALTQTGTVLGTPYYMSPEQARGDQNIGPRSDIYAMGVILFQMLTGHLPYDAPNYNALLIKILTEDAPSPLQFNPNLSEDLVDIITTAMHKEADQRFSTCLEYRDRLSAYIPGATGSYSTAMSPASQTAVRAALSNSSKSNLTPLEMTRSGGIGMPKSRVPLVAGIATAATVMIAVIVMLLVGGESAEPAPKKPVQIAPVEMPPAVKPVEQEEEKEEAAPQTVNVKISAQPRLAEITIDGQKAESNPFELTVPKNENTLHKIEISAFGYTTVTTETKYDKDKALTFSLSKKEKRRRSSSSRTSQARAKPKPAPKPAVEPAPKPAQPKRKPRRQIDDADPWRN